MTTPHRTLQMALDALDAITDDVDGTSLNTMPSFDKALDAITALREALAAPEPEPVAYIAHNGESRNLCWHNPGGEKTPLYAAPPAAPDHLRDTTEKAAPAAPVPAGWVMAPREPTPEMRKAAADAWLDCGSKLILNKAAAAIRAAIAASPAAPAAPVVREPLTDEQIRSMWMSSEFRGNGGQADWFCEGIRAAEARHGITGGKP